MSQGSPLAEIIKTSARQLRARLDHSFIKHSGEKGRVREEAVRNFIRQQLAGQSTISTGFAFDCHGHLSKQLDILIHDPQGRVYSLEDQVSYARIESTLAVGEVKTKITSRRELWEALDNLRSVSSLDRSANGRARCAVSGHPIDHTRDYLDRVFTFLFVTQKGLEPETARRVLTDYVSHHNETHEWPCVIYFLDSFLITYHCNDGVCPNTTHARGISLIKDDGLNIIRFTQMLGDAISVTSRGRVSDLPYLPELAQAEPVARVYYSTRNLADEDPPYISEWHTGTNIQKMPLPAYMRDNADD